MATDMYYSLGSTEITLMFNKDGVFVVPGLVSPIGKAMEQTRPRGREYV